jgi:hypothetical protein
MGILSSRNRSSEAWFTLQDEPVVDVSGQVVATDPQRRRGRGLVKLAEQAHRPAEPLPVAGPAAAASFGGAQFTRRTVLERLNARVRAALETVAATRYGALMLAGAVALLVMLLIVVWAAGSGSDQGLLHRDQARIARLSAERARALGAGARAETALATAQADWARWRSLAMSERAAPSVRALPGRTHSKTVGAGR